MAALDLGRLAKDTSELREQVRASFQSNGNAPDSAPGAPMLPRDAAAADVVLAAPRRVRPIPKWRLRAVAPATQLLLLLGAGTWMKATQYATALATPIPPVQSLAQA